MMWKAILESSFIGKILFCGLVCLLVWFMQARYERVQKQLAKKEEQCLVLQNANKKQQESFARLELEYKKHEKILVQLDTENKTLAQNYRAKQKQVYQKNDKESSEWKQDKIPDGILQILKKK